MLSHRLTVDKVICNFLKKHTCAIIYGHAKSCSSKQTRNLSAGTKYNLCLKHKLLFTGSRGFKGSKGFRGYRGQSGDPGDPGRMGPPGRRGTKGNPGSAQCYETKQGRRYRVSCSAMSQQPDQADDEEKKPSGAFVFTRWGRTTCPRGGAKLVYSGQRAFLRPVQTNATCWHNIALHCWAQHVAFVCTPCRATLHGVGICFVQFETSQTFCPTYASISFVFMIDEVCRNMLGSFARFTQHCWDWACAL